MLAEKYTLAALTQLLLPREKWRPFPPAADRAAWVTLLDAPLNRRRRDWLVAQAEQILGTPWPALPATLYMDFSRTGNRARFEEPYFARRARLGILVLAECMTGAGRFVDEIVNGLWLILEESSWCLPAHTGGPSLPAPDTQFVDLFACETAYAVSEAWFLLDKELAAVAPALAPRLRQEVLRRVIEPIETRSDINWFDGYNNWTPWCSANTLGAAMFVLDDPPRLATLAHRLMGCVDRFLARYAPDGGCDEGPVYWGVAGGALLLFLEHLHSRSNGAVSMYDQPLIAGMGRFIVAVHLDGPWFFNFGDGGACAGLPRAVTWRYGERIGDRDMMALARLVARGGRTAGPVEPPLQPPTTGAFLTHGLRELFWMPADEEPVVWQKPLDVFLPDLEVMQARQSSAPGRGLVLAAKAGNNAASHNHNDIGHFVLWLNGEPVVIDLGVETYTRKTFSPERYSIWTIRASAHNAPLVNGHEQLAGKQYTVTEVRHYADAARAEMTMELGKAYGAAAGVRSLQREITFDRTAVGEVTVTDRCAVASGPLRLVIALFTPAVVTADGAGVLLFATSKGRVELRFDSRSTTARLERVEISDPWLRRTWPAPLTRVELACESATAECRSELRWRVVGEACCFLAENP